MAADERGGADGLLVERAVEPPPDALQDLHEVVRRRRARTASRARAPSRGGYARRRCRARRAALGVAAALPVRRCGDAPSVDPDVADDADGVERGHDHRAARGSRAPCGTAARAAGESFIGRRVRWMPSKASSAPRDCGGRWHERRLADALGAVRALRLGLLDEDDLDLRHAGRRDEVQRLERLVTRHAVLDDELLGERLAEAHVHAALDLALGERRVDRPADVVGGDDLRRAGPRRRGSRPGSPTPYARCVTGSAASFGVSSRPMNSPRELPAGESSRRPPFSPAFSFLAASMHGVAAEHGRARRGRLPGVELALGVDRDA